MYHAWCRLLTECSTKWLTSTKRLHQVHWTNVIGSWHAENSAVYYISFVQWYLYFGKKYSKCLKVSDSGWILFETLVTIWRIFDMYNILRAGFILVVRCKGPRDCTQLVPLERDSPVIMTVLHNRPSWVRLFPALYFMTVEQIQFSKYFTHEVCFRQWILSNIILSCV